MKLNPAHTIFDGNMFAQLRDLLDPITAPDSLAVIDMSIGEPQQPPTSLLTDSVVRHNDQWQFYPKPNGSPRFTEAVENYIAQRWPEAIGLADKSQIIPVPGTREPLHLLGHLVNGSKTNAAALVTNPFYHAWRAGALASGGEIIYLNSAANLNFLPNLQALNSATLDRACILFLCSPTNPQGSVMDLDYLVAALRLARSHDFLLVMDECYADIWRGSPPPGMMQAAAAVAHQDGVDSNGDPLANIVVLNSLSKRSGAAGLRAGFMIGDTKVIAQYLKFVGNGGSLVPTPFLSVAADLYEDELHVADIRAYYDANFALAQKHLGITPPQGGFFLWLKVDDDVQFVKRLMAEQAVRALPGSFMGVENAFGNPGAGYVRLALVHDLQSTDEALGRVATIYNCN
ncbi:aminotransferase class I/II-fold pyridoxal phosphate-dependent enzyme [Candidatus Puniceispirillum sp.]|nr:aminotransferase class I/II-fold pyridoxal phosphate-dependent enzyme [Candidatus Puniceispirillum sp.]